MTKEIRNNPSVMFSTVTIIMSSGVITDNSVISANVNTVVSGGKLEITVTNQGQSVIYNAEGMIVGLSGAFQGTIDYSGTDCAGKAVYHNGAKGAVKAEWTAPNIPGTYTIWVGTAGGYGQVARGKIDITVIAENNPATKSSSSSSSQTSMDATTATSMDASQTSMDATTATSMGSSQTSMDATTATS